MLILTVASDLNNPGLAKLKASLERFGYDYHVIQAPFVFGGQMPHVYEWAKEQDPAMVFLYTDAYDTVALGELPPVIQSVSEGSALTGGGDSTLAALTLNDARKMIISCEKACFPHPELADQYPPAPYAWKYVNGGGWMTTAGFFCQLYEDGTYEKHKNDQLWLTHEFLSANRQPATGNRQLITLDTNCQIFQTIAFEAEGDFTYGKSLHNLKTNTRPIFIHGNGRTDMTKVWALPVLHE